MIVLVRDFVEAGYCIAGVRRWAEGVGLHWREFVSQGAESRKLIKLAAGDTMLDAVLENARRRRRDERR